MAIRSGNRPWLTFAATSAVLAAGTACLSLTSGGSVDHRESALRSNPDPASGSGSARAIQSFQAQLRRRSRGRQRVSENRAYRASLSADAGRVASRFVRAYLLYEVGKADHKSLSIIRESTTPQLRRKLLDRPVRIRAGSVPTEARLIEIGSVRAAAVSGGRGFAVAVVVARRGSPQQVLGISIVVQRPRLVVAEIGR